MIRSATACLVLLISLFLGACATTGQPTDTAQRALQIARTGYLTAAIVVKTYDSLTPCGQTGAARICRDDATASQLVKALATAKAAIDAADVALDTAGSDLETREKVIVIAQSAVTVLLQALITFGLAA